MYLYTHKTNKHENEQAQLLEMCCDACLCIGNGKDADGIIRIQNLYSKGCGY